MAIQISLAKLLMDYGVKPGAIVGHSIGEVAAAHIAGALSLQQAVQVIYHRSRIQDKQSGKGKMLAVGISIEEAEKLLVGYGKLVSIATINGPEMITLAGAENILNKIAEKLENRVLFNLFVNVKVPYHSFYMEEIKDELIETLGNFRGEKSLILLFSSVTSRQEDGAHLSGDYWYKNVREPVLITQTLENMHQASCDFFIEIGPNPVLVSGAESLFKKLNIKASAVASMNRKEEEYATLHSCLGNLFAYGWDINPEKFFGTDNNFFRLPIMFGSMKVFGLSLRRLKKNESVL